MGARNRNNGAMKVLSAATVFALACLRCATAQVDIVDPQLLGTVMVVRGTDAYVFGGMGTNSSAQQDSLEYASGLQDVWMFDFVTSLWIEVSPNNAPSRGGKCPTAEGVKKMTSGARSTVAVSPSLCLLWGIAAVVALTAGRA